MAPPIAPSGSIDTELLVNLEGPPAVINSDVPISTKLIPNLDVESIASDDSSKPIDGVKPDTNTIVTYAETTSSGSILLSDDGVEPSNSFEPIFSVLPSRPFQPQTIVPADDQSRWSSSSDGHPTEHNVVSLRADGNTQYPRHIQQVGTLIFPVGGRQDTSFGGAISSQSTDLSQPYPEFSSTPTIVQRGGFGLLPKFEGPEDRGESVFKFYRRFPPASNEEYELTTDARDPKFVFPNSASSHASTPEIEATTPDAEAWRGNGYFARSAPPQQSIQDFGQPSVSGFGGVEEQSRWHDKEVKLLGLGLGDLGTDEDRVLLYRQASRITKQIIVSCWRCGSKHIVSGSLQSLPERDTCGAYLPSWFPAEKFENPWKECTSLWGEIVYLVESGRDYKFNLPGIVQQKPTVSMEYHTADRKWKHLNVNCQGWWRCRSGPEATQVELNCKVCHKTRVVDEDPFQKAFDARKQALVKWVYDCLKHMGYDKETAKAAEAIVLRQGLDRISHYRYEPKEDIMRRSSSVTAEKYTRAVLDDATTFNPRVNARTASVENEKAGDPHDMKIFPTMMRENYDPSVSEDEKILYEQLRPEMGDLRARENQGQGWQSPRGDRATYFEEQVDSAAYLEKERRSLVARWAENAADAEPEVPARSVSTGLGPSSVSLAPAQSASVVALSNFRRARADTVSDLESVVFEDMMMNNSRTF